MNIHQVSVTYVHEQDRLLMRINTQADGGSQDHAGEKSASDSDTKDSTAELRLWLTRRLTLALMPALQNHAGEQLSRSMPGQAGQIGPAAPVTPVELQRERLLEAFKVEAAAYGGDFNTPYQEPSTAPMASQSAPLLVTEVVIALQASGQLQMKFSQKLENATRDVELGMQPQLTQGLLHLLNLGVQQSGWLEVPAQRSVQALAPGALATLAGIDRTGYLN